MRNENENENALQQLAVLNQKLVHDITSPLTNIRHQAMCLDTIIPTLLHAYEQAVNLGLVEPISEAKKQSLTTVANRLETQIDEIADVVDQYWEKANTFL